MTIETKVGIIVGFINDLMAQVKVEEAAQRLGFRVEWIEGTAQLISEEQLAEDEALPSRPRRPSEPVSGPEAVLVERLTVLSPALLVFDLGSLTVPAFEWIAILKSSAATRRIPLLCYGAHVEGAMLKRAQSAGADVTLARSAFFQNLPELLQRHARRPDSALIAAACTEELSLQARRGLEEFNRGEYFEAHEYLEGAWNADSGAGRDLYRAVLQVAVAYLHIVRGNYNGAVKMFLRMRQWIDPLPPVCRGIDVAQLRADAEQVRLRLLALGPQRIREFDRRLLRPVNYAWPGAGGQSSGAETG